MSNEEYRQFITEMLYQMDGEEDNLFLKQVFTIVHRHFIRKEPESRKPSDRYRGKVLQIISKLDKEEMKGIYCFLEAYTGIGI